MSAQRKTLQQELREAAASVDSCRAVSELMVRAADRIDALHREMRDAEREFQREARDIAAETRWQVQAERDGDPYGTY